MVVFDNRADDIETETQMRLFIFLPTIRNHRIEDLVLRFAFLRELQAGDVLLVQGKSGKRIYQVQTTTVVRAEDLYLDREGAGQLTLITCFPFEAVMPGTPLRFVVTAESVAAKPRGGFWLKKPQIVVGNIDSRRAGN